MRYNDAGFLEDTIGMPESHKTAFLNVARSQQCVIIVRATGPTCAADHRPLGTVKGRPGAEAENVDHLERNFTVNHQGTKLGNITNRIYMVCQLVNSLVGRNVLWHSDEAARPFLEDVDLPVLALSPAGTHFGIETIDDFKVFIAACEAERIHVTLSNAWAQDVAGNKTKRLGAAYGRYVPADGIRVMVPDWYNA